MMCGMKTGLYFSKDASYKSRLAAAASLKILLKEGCGVSYHQRAKEVSLSARNS